MWGGVEPPGGKIFDPPGGKNRDSGGGVKKILRPFI